MLLVPGSFLCARCGHPSSWVPEHIRTSRARRRRTLLVGGGMVFLLLMGTANAWVALIPGLVLLGSGVYALTDRKRRSLLGLLYRVGNIWYAGGTLILGVLLVTCGVLSFTAVDGRNASHDEANQQPQRTAQSQDDRKHAQKEALRSQLTAKLDAWTRAYAQTEALANRGAYAKAHERLKHVIAETTPFVEAFTPPPDELGSTVQRLRKLANELEAAKGMADAARRLPAEVVALRRHVEDKRWYQAAESCQAVEETLERLMAEGVRKAYQPKDIDIKKQEKRVASACDKARDKAISPKQLTVRQYLSAPESIQQRAVELQFSDLEHDKDVGDLIRTARSSGVRKETILGIKHCSDGLMRKDRKVTRSAKLLFSDIDVITRKSRPASETIKLCTAIFFGVVMSVANDG